MFGALKERRGHGEQGLRVFAARDEKGGGRDTTHCASGSEGGVGGAAFWRRAARGSQRTMDEQRKSSWRIDVIKSQLTRSDYFLSAPQRPRDFLFY